MLSPSVNSQPDQAPSLTHAEGDCPGGAYGGLDDYFLAHGLTHGYDGEPLPARALADLSAELRTHTVRSNELRETRALWVSRFDLPAQPNPAAIQTIVDKAAYAHLNTILFQVRGQADALYHSSLEPWSSYAGAGFGQDPGWDPLAEMVLRAHAQGLEVHAWINAYPAWRGKTPPAEVQPRPMYHEFNSLYGDWWVQWRQATPPVPMTLNDNYLCACPAHPAVVERIVAVARELVERYPLDGLHFDYIRYDDRMYSYDPASLIAYANAAANTPGLTYADWQRAHVTALLQRVRDEALPLRARARLSTSAWPVYKDRWNWFNGYDGYSARYQDSQGWAANAVVSAIMPMMYGPSFTNYRDRYETMARDFVSGARPGAVFMGISGEYTSFAEIAWRIDTARAAGARGQALFSYSLFDQRGYWQALRDGPYREIATPDWPLVSAPSDGPGS